MILLDNLILSLSGHLLSTAEVESALVEHEAVAEAAVVGTPHPVKGESLYCFVTLKDGIGYTATLEAELKKQGLCLCCFVRSQRRSVFQKKFNNKRPLKILGLGICYRLNCSPGVTMCSATI